MKKILIRADAYSGIGIGHVMRCLALAQAWQDRGGQTVLASSMLSPGLRARLRAEGMEYEHISASPGSAFDAMQTAASALANDLEWVVVDGYHFGSDYQRILKDAGLHVLLIDDNNHAAHYCADLILNQNIHADESMYTEREPHTRLLLGTDYVLLRREFLSARAERYALCCQVGTPESTLPGTPDSTLVGIPESTDSRVERDNPEVVTNLLVTMGGSDPDNVTSAVVRALQQVGVSGLMIKVVVGGNYMHYDELLASTTESQIPIQLVVSPTSMPELMKWADLAVSASGTTCWEMAYLGLPALLLTIADNQRTTAERLHQCGAFVTMCGKQPLDERAFRQNLRALIFGKDLRATLSRNASQLVDGLGAHRVFGCMLETVAVEG